MSVLLGSVAVQSLIAYGACIVAGWLGSRLAREQLTGNNLNNNQVQPLEHVRRRDRSRNAPHHCVNILRWMSKFLVFYIRTIKVSHSIAVNSNQVLMRSRTPCANYFLLMTFLSQEPVECVEYLFEFPVSATWRLLGLVLVIRPTVSHVCCRSSISKVYADACIIYYCKLAPSVCIYAGQ
jgi:hypothetical protein